MAQLVDNRLCLRLVTVAQSHRWRQCSFLTERQTCFFFPSSEPTHCWISGASRSTQPTAVSFVTLFTHMSVEVYYVIAVYTNLLYCSPSPVHHTLTVHCLCCLCAWEQKTEQLLVHFECCRETTDRCIDQMEKHVLQRLVVKSLTAIFRLSDTSVYYENKDSYQNI